MLFILTEDKCSELFCSNVKQLLLWSVLLSTFLGIKIVHAQNVLTSTMQHEPHSNRMLICGLYL